MATVLPLHQEALGAGWSVAFRVLALVVVVVQPGKRMGQAAAKWGNGEIYGPAMRGEGEGVPRDVRRGLGRGVAGGSTLKMLNPPMEAARQKGRVRER